MRLEYFSNPDVSNKWFWSLVQSNGQIIAVGGEGYVKKGNVIRAAKRMAAIMLEGHYLVPVERKAVEA